MSPAFPHFHMDGRDSFTLAGAALPLWSCSPLPVTSFLSVLFSPALRSQNSPASRAFRLLSASESPGSFSATCTRSSSHFLKIKQPDSLCMSQLSSLTPLLPVLCPCENVWSLPEGRILSSSSFLLPWPPAANFAEPVFCLPVLL